MSSLKLVFNLCCSTIILLLLSACSVLDNTSPDVESAVTDNNPTAVQSTESNNNATSSRLVNAINETHRRYGVKGAALTYTPISDKISRYRVKGKTYTTLSKAASRQFSQKGVASYYGGSFHGRKTASGEIFDQYAYTAAHKTLALGSYALVTNLRNGRKVIVRINDRGPFSKGRVIDLSVAAAREIGMYQSGVANVNIEAIQVDKQGYLSGKGVESLYQIAKRKKLPLLTKGEGKKLTIKAK
ncbi:MAG: septal ring lytic transglycosylase RlpA family protein [Pasteurellaceae bacterium]|nr:septal ring lytic transglycosylase RlpA family protein [Pasteurellaceae bacterium]